VDAEVREWVARAVGENGLEPTGELEPVKVRAWASVLRMGTSGGDVYFKANAPGGRHEPALQTELAREWPDRVPAPLAADAERGWLLTADHGRRLSDTRSGNELLATWEELLPRYAELQLASARAPERWLRLGVPDRRLERIPALTEVLIRENADLADAERSSMLALLPDLEARCRELGALPCAAALEHGDLHGGNVLVGRGQSWFFDWADASVSYPFCSLLVTCNMAIDDLQSTAGRRASARLRDAYLEPWTSVAPAALLRSLFPTALWVAHVGRALDWDCMLTGAEGPDRAEWLPRIAPWLRRWRDRSAWTRKNAWP
jgi:hypothetical protein